MAKCQSVVSTLQHEQGSSNSNEFSRHNTFVSIVASHSESDHLGDPSVDGRIILNYILKIGRRV
jgi:hypothetical protein